MEDLNNDNKFEEFELAENFLGLNTENLFSEIWIKPKKVFIYLFSTNPNKYVELLFIVGAVCSALDRSLEKYQSYFYYSIASYIGIFILATLITWGSYYLYVWILKFVGNGFLKGTASVSDYKTILAWSLVPAIASILPTLFMMMLYGVIAVSDSYQPETTTVSIVFIVVGVLQIILGIWSLCILVTGIKYVQKFTVWKAILNVLIPIVAFVIIFMLLLIVSGVM